ncbi:MAG: YicC family protein [Rectinema sp.]|nr:YicC family protein [Rectinema sp.]
MKSMTGFAHCAVTTSMFKGTITLKSYNNRFFDLSLALPQWLSSIEPQIREFFGSRIARGKVECAIRLKREEAASSEIQINIPFAKTLAEQLRVLARECAIDQEPSLEFLATFPGTIDSDSELDAMNIWRTLEPFMEQTWKDFDESRTREGLATLENIHVQLERIKKRLDETAGHADQIESYLRAQITARFKELLGNGYDEGRVLQEVAVQMVRLTINEELHRLRTHIEAFETMEKEPACGKKLDFLCQEMNREINTIGSKNMLVPVSLAVVEMKDALENIREQIRNVE